MKNETTDEAEILDAIRAVAREHLDYEGPMAPEAHLVEELRLDSLRLLTLAVEIENRFRIRLEPEDEARLETVADLVSTVRRKLASAADGAADAEVPE